MANPWTKKNPFLSMFLSGTNAAVSRGRVLSVQNARRTHAVAAKQVTKTWIDFWTSGSGRKRKRTK